MKALLTKNVIILVIALSLSACGYHLRGSVDLPHDFQKVYLAGGSMQLREQLRRTLRASSGQLVNTPETAELIIRISEEKTSQRALSLSAGGRSNELELIYHLKYDLMKANNTLLLAEQPIDIKRQYFNSQQDIMAKENEQAVISNEMHQQAVRAIIDRSRFALEAKTK